MKHAVDSADAIAESFGSITTDSHQTRSSMLRAARIQNSALVRANGSLMAVSLLLALGCASHPKRVDVPSETSRLPRARPRLGRRSLRRQGRRRRRRLLDRRRARRHAGSPTVQGKTAIHGMVARGFATPGFHVTWIPGVRRLSLGRSRLHARHERVRPTGRGRDDDAARSLPHGVAPRRRRSVAMRGENYLDYRSARTRREVAMRGYESVASAT